VKRFFRGMTLWIVLLLSIILLYQMLGLGGPKNLNLIYSQFLDYLNDGNIKSVVITEDQINGDFVTEVRDKNSVPYKSFETLAPVVDSDFVTQLRAKGVEIEVRNKGNSWTNILLSIAPWVIIILVWFFMFRQLQGGSNRALSFGKSRAKLVTEDRPKTTFNDVAGADEAKEELQEIIEFLKDPRKFSRLGGKIPKGVLIVGPPGTGKTLLARAVAGEANVPFLSISGSDFVEMFVGVGASRVRDLFEQGKKNAPCIIFIDEIDAVGRMRGAGLGGGHDEREQTLNQLLVEMDGFETNEGVILIAATNRPDVLDTALLRPGRFDRQVVLDRPDLKGRVGILQVHTRKIPLAKDVDLEVIARGTPYFSGADLANLVNEAALLAARKGLDEVTMAEMEEARDKVMMGPERKSHAISDQEKKLIAYHEAGHALVGSKIPGSDPVHKISIIPRGMALGVTQTLPIDEKHTYPRDYLEGMIARALGGRASEEIIFGEITTGAQDDIERASDLVRKMVTTWGMSDVMGPIAYGKKDEQIFLGREIAQHRDYSEETAEKIDAEVKRIMMEQYERAKKILLDNKATLEKIANALVERETLTGEELELLLEGKKLPKYQPKSDKPAEETKPADEQEVPPAKEEPPDSVSVT
jgi:cell division protease FtsH